MKQEEGTLKRTLEFAKTEIKDLRRTNQRMSDRLSGFDDALRLLNSATPSSGAYHCEDVVTLIDRELNDLTAQKSEG